MDQTREILRQKRYSIRKEKSYSDRIGQFIIFHNKRHPREMNAPEVTEFLSHLAVERNVEAST